MELSIKLKSARKSCNLTQTQAAKLLGITNTTLSNWENDVSKPDIDMLKKICEIYDINPNDIYEWDKQKTAFDLHSKNEVILLSSYRKLNGDGQQRVIEYTDDLLSSGKYSDTEDPFADVRREVANIKIPKAE